MPTDADSNVTEAPTTWQGGRRPMILDATIRNRLVAAVQRGMTLGDAATFAGISYRTIMNWRARARELAEWVPSDWREMRVPELQELAAEMGISASDLRGRGAGGRPLKADWINALQQQVGVYLDLQEDLDLAAVQGKARLYEAVQEVSLGRRVELDEAGRARLTPRRYREETVEYDSRNQVTKRIVRDREVEPDTATLRWFMSRRFPEEMGRQREAPGRFEEPEVNRDSVQEFLAAVAAMEESVPNAPDSEGESGDG